MIMSNDNVLNNNGDLIVCCNFLIRVETLLEVGTRSQIPKNNIDIITKCLTRVIEFINTDVPDFDNQIIIFGNCIEAIDTMAETGVFMETSEDLKTYLVDKLSPAIVEFKVNVGKYLTNGQFSYTPAQDTVIKNIIEVCLDNGYYFGY